MTIPDPIIRTVKFWVFTYTRVVAAFDALQVVLSIAIGRRSFAISYARQPKPPEAPTQ